MKKLLKRLCSAMVAAVMVMTMAPAAFAADGGAQFQNGPYLLAPKTNSMVVVWESTEKVSATIAYGTDESKLCDPIKVEIDADAPDFKGSKMNLFHYKLDNLTPGTRYYYEVKLEGGATCKASFKTLSEKPDQIRLITLSDSHIFATRAELDQAIKEFDPDLRRYGRRYRRTGRAVQLLVPGQGRERLHPLLSGCLFLRQPRSGRCILQHLCILYSG